MAFSTDKTRQGAAGVSTTGFTIDESIRYDEDRGTVLTRTFGGVGNQKTFTISAWTKPSLQASYQALLNAYQDDANWTVVGSFDLGEGSPTLKVLYQRTGNVSTPIVITNAVFRDPSAWYHIVITIDTTEGTPADRVKLWVNGVQVTSFGTATLPGLNDDIDWINTAMSHRLMAQHTGYGDGYLAEYHFIDGTAYDADDFGEFGDYGEWKPIEVSGLTYGTNGFYLDFADSGALGDDESGNTNDFTATNFVATDQVLDTPTNNFCTLNPLNADQSTADLVEGNLKISHDSADFNGSVATMGISSGKYYWEGICNGDHTVFGIVKPEQQAFNYRWYPGKDTLSYGYMSSANVFHDDSVIDTYATFGAGDIMSFTLDDGTFKAYKNNVLEGTIVSGLTGEWLPAASTHNWWSGTKWSIMNFGQDSSFAGEETAQGNQDDNGIGDFYYDVPAGFLALCTSNLPEPAVIPSEHFNTVLYTGTGASQTIRGVGFQPDFLIVKSRSNGGNHSSMNAITGAGNTLYTNDDNAEIDYTAYITDFDADGFDTGTEGGVVNYTDYTYVAWNWKANGSGSANTDGDMAETVTVSANTDAGFSIVTYTGDGSAATVGHGLSKAPEMILVKNRDAGDSWRVYHANNTAAPETDYLILNEDAGTGDAAENWNDTAPTADVFTIGDGASVNTDDDNYVAYCFHSVDGYSKVGSYTGNGNNPDGTFMYTGFRVAWVLIKRTLSGDSWVLFDSTRDTYNLANRAVNPDSSTEEQQVSNAEIDFLSNGFKLRENGNWINGNGAFYIYLAFAETPFKYSNAR